MSDSQSWTTHNGVCVRGSVYVREELDYHETIDMVELLYSENRIVLFKRK